MDARHMPKQAGVSAEQNGSDGRPLPRLRGGPHRTAEAPMLQRKNDAFGVSGHADCRPKYRSDVDELVALMRESTGMIEDRQLVDEIRGQLELRGGTLRAYMDDMRPRLGRLKTRPRFGFFYSEALKWGSVQRAPAPDPVTAEQEAKRNARCAKCNGGGMVLEQINGQRPRQTAEACQCPMMGREMARQLARKPDEEGRAVPHRKPPGGDPAMVARAL